LGNCDRLLEAITKDELRNWDISRAAMELKQAWDHKVQGLRRITKAAFAVEPER
jgi:hypothetical protein